MDAFDIQKVGYRWLRRAIGVLGMAPPVTLSGVPREPRRVRAGDVDQRLRAHGPSVPVRDDPGHALGAALRLPGYDEDDDFAGHLAGLSAVGVVVFPTNAPGTPMDLRAWTHITCAAAMFLLLAAFCLPVSRHGRGPQAGRTRSEHPGRRARLPQGAEGETGAGHAQGETQQPVPFLRCRHRRVRGRDAGVLRRDPERAVRAELGLRLVVRDHRALRLRNRLDGQGRHAPRRSAARSGGAQAAWLKAPPLRRRRCPRSFRPLTSTRGLSAARRDRPTLIRQSRRPSPPSTSLRSSSGSPRVCGGFAKKRGEGTR